MSRSSTRLLTHDEFADTDGELRYVDGNREPIADEAGVAQRARSMWWQRLRRGIGGRP
jgi:hypothetical protein